MMTGMAKPPSPHPMVGMAFLPPEMTDRIIDFLYDDRKALSICGQVCGRWVSASRYHLFATIHLRTRVRTHVEIRIDLSIICNPRSTVHEYVQYLSIHGRMGRWTKEARDRRLNNIFSQLPKFPILRRLSLYDISNSRLSSPSQNWIDAQMETITSLALHNVHFHSPDTTFRLIATARRTRSLTISNISWNSQSLDPICIVRPPRLSRLSIASGGEHACLIAWLAKWEETFYPSDLVLCYGDFYFDTRQHAVQNILDTFGDRTIEIVLTTHLLQEMSLGMSFVA